MSLYRSTAYRYLKALIIGPCIAASLYACTTDDSSVSDPNNSSTNPPGATGSTEHPSGTITGDSVWAPGNHTVDGTITFTSGTLTIQAGATVIMTVGSGTSLLFGKNAALVIEGTSTSPVLFTSSSPTPKPGDWGNIDFQVGSLPSTIDNANIVYGGPSNTSGAVVIEAGTTVRVTNTAVENSGGFGVLVSGDANINGFAGNTLAHNTAGPISLPANSVSGLGAGTYTPNDVEGINVEVSQLSQNANWVNLGVPYVLEGLTVETLTGQAVLNVAAGITLLMAKSSTLVVQKNAGLILAGTQDSPITVTSASSPAARGDWGDIEFYTNSLGSINTIAWADIGYGGGSQQGEVWLESDSAARIDNSIITNSLGIGVTVQAHATLHSFSNNTMAHNASYPIAIDVDDVRQLQPYVNTYVPNDQTGISVTGSPLVTDQTWGPLGTNYFVQESFVVDFGLQSGVTTWTIEAGTGITLGNNIHIAVTEQGRIFSNGTDRSTGQVNFSGQGAQPVDGTEWSALIISGAPSELHYTRFRYGGLGSEGTVWVQGAPTLFDNVDIPLIAAAAAHIDYVNCVGNGLTIDLPYTDGFFPPVPGDPNTYCQ